MGIETELLKHLDSHPIVVTILLLAAMFFITVWWKGWPGSFGEDEDEIEVEGEDTIEDGKHITLYKTDYEADENGIPEKISFQIRITDYKL